MKERLHNTIQQRGRSSKILIVCGLGGAGKSQLTLSYIESYRNDYTAVFWIDAGSKIRLEADYKQIRNLLRSSRHTDAGLHTCVAEIKQWCDHMQGRWLFVLDSADDIDDPQSSAYIDLQRVIIDVPSADVIITTRCQSAKDMTDLEAVQVAELTSAEARDLFLRRSKLPSPSGEVCEEVDEITKELGFFALAISLAAAYVSETPRLRRNPGGYLDEYKRRRKALLERRPKAHVDQYGASVLTTWETSYAAISDRCPEACNLLMFLAFLSPDDLFLEVLQPDDAVIFSSHAKWLFTKTSPASVQEVLDSSFEILGSYSLLLWRDEQSSYSMHRLVHTWIFERSEINAKVEFCKFALIFLSYYFLTFHACVVTQGVVASAQMVPHVMTCFTRTCEVYAESGDDEVHIVDMLSHLADVLYYLGESDRGSELYSFVHEHQRREYGADDDKCLESSARLGQAMLSQGGKSREVVKLLRPALARHREAHDPDHRSALGFTLVRTLGRAFNQLGETTEAESLLRQALSECETRFDILMTMRSLASVLTGTNRNKEAVELSGQAFEGFEELFGPTDPQTLYALLDYAKALNFSRQYKKSNALIRRALHDFTASFGPQHVRTVVCMAEYGSTFRLLGDLKQANRILRRSLSQLETTLGIGHPLTLNCVFDLGMCLRDQGSYPEAVLLFQRASDGYAAAFGNDNSRAVLCSRMSACLKSALQERWALHEVFEQASANFGECLRARQHLQRPLVARGRAFSFPGEPSGTRARRDRNLMHQVADEQNDESEWETLSDSGSDVMEIYSRI